MTPERRTLLREKIAVVKPRRWDRRMMSDEMIEFAEQLAELAEELLEASDRETPEDTSHDDPMVTEGAITANARAAYAQLEAGLHSPGYARGYAAYMNGDCEPPDGDDETFAADWNAGMDAAVLHHEAPDARRFELSTRERRIIGWAVGLAAAFGFLAGALWAFLMWGS